jgi:hypothetical protein
MAFESVQLAHVGFSSSMKCGSIKIFAGDITSIFRAEKHGERHALGAVVSPARSGSLVEEAIHRAAGYDLLKIHNTEVI